MHGLNHCFQSTYVVSLMLNDGRARAPGTAATLMPTGAISAQGSGKNRALLYRMGKRNIVNFYIQSSMGVFITQIMSPLRDFRLYNGFALTPRNYMIKVLLYDYNMIIGL